MNLTSKKLNKTHIGKTITIPGNVVNLSGRIVAISKRHCEIVIVIRDRSLYSVLTPRDKIVTIQEEQ